MTDKSSLIAGTGRLQPSVIFMDLSYAVGNLSDLIRELREHAPAAKLLLLSVHDEPTVVAAAVAAGADGLVLKRAIAYDLMPAIDAVRAGRRYFESSAEKQPRFGWTHTVANPNRAKRMRRRSESHATEKGSTLADSAMAVRVPICWTKCIRSCPPSLWCRATL